MPNAAPDERTVQIPLLGLTGDLVIPANARGIVVFAHGTGSSRFSSRNRFVAGVLQERGFATLLLDLLTEQEERTDLMTAEFRFDIPLLGERVVAAIDWTTGQEATGSLPVTRSSPRETKIQPLSPMNLMPLGNVSDTVMWMSPGYVSST